MKKLFSIFCLVFIAMTTCTFAQNELFTHPDVKKKLATFSGDTTEIFFRIPHKQYEELQDKYYEDKLECGEHVRLLTCAKTYATAETVHMEKYTDVKIVMPFADSMYASFKKNYGNSVISLLNTGENSSNIWGYERQTIGGLKSGRLVDDQGKFLQENVYFPSTLMFKEFMFRFIAQGQTCGLIVGKSYSFDLICYKKSIECNKCNIYFWSGIEKADDPYGDLRGPTDLSDRYDKFAEAVEGLELLAMYYIQDGKVFWIEF